MSTHSQQVVTLSAVHSLNSENLEKPAVWKEFGAYLEKRLEIQPRTDSKTSTKSALIVNTNPDESYLRTNIKFKICFTCNRPIGEKNLASHYKRCIEMSKQKPGAAPINQGLKRKRGKAGNNLFDDVSSVDSSRNSTPGPALLAQPVRPKKKYKKSQTQKEKEAANAAAAAAAAASTSSPMKRDDVSAGSTAKKKKAPKAKSSAKAKGPVDVEKQCGVPLPSGGFCARSLTCKTHSMGAKRAVMGRSAPYDILLLQYQKRNQAKLAASNALAAQRRENAEFNGPAENDESALARVLDPDEETHLVLEGLLKNNPMPLERKIILPVRNRQRFLSLREFYANAMIMGTGTNNANSNANSPQSTEQTLANQAISGSIGGLQGRCALINVDAPSQASDSVTQSFSAIPGEMYQVRAPLKAILMTAQQNAMQQQAFQQQVLKMQKQQMLMMKQRQKMQG